MKPGLLRVYPLVLALASAANAWCGTVTWDGGGGDFSWQTAANWSSNALPGTADDVLIDVAGNVTITSSANVTILSLQCSNNLALSGGTFRVTAGSSMVQGQFSVSGNPTLSAEGAVTELFVAGGVSANGASFEASDGATISLPGLTNYSKGPGCAFVRWQANGAGSSLSFPALLTLTGASCANLEIDALNGGNVLLPSLTAVNDGTLEIMADGTNSLVSLPALQQSLATDRTVAFEVRNAGTISMPQFPGGAAVLVTLRSGGVMAVDQLEELRGFVVSGMTVDFPALTNITTGSITVDGGAVVTASNLTSHADNAGCPVAIWLVSGAGSVLDLSALTSLSGESCGFLNLQATAGGTLILSNLPAITEGTVNFLADGTNSLVDLSALQQSLATALTVSFEARNGGTMWMPLLPGGPTVSVALKSGGMLPVTQLRELNGFTVTGMAVDFPALTNVTTGHITVDGGAVVTLPNLTHHGDHLGCPIGTWLVSGAGSVLDLSAFTSLSGENCGFLNLQAMAGGTLILSNLPAINEGTVNVLADGTNSLVDLSALQQSLATALTVSFEARNGGTVWMPLLPGGPTVTVALKSGGVLPVTQLRELNGFTVTGMTVDFPALTNVTTGHITVDGGAVVTLPNLTRHGDHLGCPISTWLVSGAGSVLNLSAFASLSGESCGFLNLQAMAGGTLILSNLPAINEGTVNVLADGTNSLVDLSALQHSPATALTVSFEARNHGVILMPLMQGGATVTVTIRSGGTVSLAEMDLLRGLTVSGTTLELPEITNLFSGDLTVSEGAVLRLPNLFNHDQSVGCIVNAWTASGAGSVLDLSSLTNLSGSSCGSLTVQALAGGTVILSNLPAITEGLVNFLADGLNSLVNLDALQQSLAALRAVSFEARNSGTMGVPQLAGGPTVNVTLRPNGVMPVAQMQRLGGIVVSGNTAHFPALTNIDGGAIVATNGAVVTASNLAAYVKGGGCGLSTWLVRGTGSVLNLPALSLLTGGTCGRAELQAVASGQLLLGNLGSILDGHVSVLADGSGSLVDLHSLSNFVSQYGASELRATNNGVILLKNPLVFSGVAIRVNAGNPSLPAVTLTNSSSVTLYGTPWHSYWVERRDTAAPANPWLLFQRVPLTNDFQIIAPLAGANTEFRAWEFIADPYLLDIALKNNTNVQLVLYAPTNRTLELQSTTNLAPAPTWQMFDTVTMTNTFRILAPMPASLPKQFFRAVTL